MKKIYPITRQEKILAGKDIEPITRLEYFLKQAGSGGGGGGGGGVQSDWNQKDDTAADFIKNKPFGEFSTGGDTLTWIGKEFDDTMTAFMDAFVLISDATPNVNDLSDEGLGITMLSKNGDIVMEGTVPKSEILGNQDYIILDDGFFAGDLIWIAPRDNYDLSELFGETLIIPKKGVYISAPYVTFDTYIRFNGLTTLPYQKKIDNRYIDRPTTIRINLYGGKDGYLYRTNDYGNAENRITKEEFEKIIENYSVVRIYIQQSVYIGTMIGYVIDGIYCTVRIETSDGAVEFRTAEYTAS